MTTQPGRGMDERENMIDSFDPRTWRDESDQDGGSASYTKRRFRPRRTASRPPLLLAAAASIAILSVAAAAAYLARPSDDVAVAETAAAAPSPNRR